MSNSFTAVPNVLPGNVTIGGNLTVAGDVLRVGAAAPYVRIGKSAGPTYHFSANYDFGGSVRDTANYAWDHAFVQGVPGEQVKRFNNSGSLQNEALVQAIFTDYTAHVNTGNTTENTIYSKTLVGSLIWTNGGLRIRYGYHVTTQGAGTSHIRVKLAGTVEQDATVVTADQGNDGDVEVLMLARNSISSQLTLQRKLVSGTVVIAPPISDTVNTANDQPLTITVQSPNGTDSITINFIIIELMNTWGPVT